MWSSVQVLSPIKSSRSGRSRKASGSSQRVSEPIDIEDDETQSPAASVRTTRSGKVFSNMELRDGSPAEDESMDMDEGEEWRNGTSDTKQE